MKSTTTLTQNASNADSTHPGAEWPLFLGCNAELLFFPLELQHGLEYLGQLITEKFKVRPWKPCRGLASQCIRTDITADC
jgi:hypothetical protein